MNKMNRKYQNGGEELKKRRRAAKSPTDNLRVDDLPSVSGYLSTGCTVLDLAIADRLPGGFGMGRISHIFGPESTTKSIISLEPLGSAQRQGGIAYHVDSEGTLDFPRAEDLFGVNMDKLNYISANTCEREDEDLTIEYLFDEIIEDIFEQSDGKTPYVLTVDSLSAITSGKELADNDPYGASRAKALSAAFRKNIWRFAKKNLSLIFVDQTRQNVGVTFGEKHTFSGGEALKFYASTRIKLTKSGNILNKHKKIIGVKIHFKVDKNKIAPPFREGDFRLLFDFGIDDISTNVDFLNDNGKFGTKKGWYEYRGAKFRFDDLIEYIEDENLEKDIEKLVYKTWREVYQPVQRKRKRR